MHNNYYFLRQLSQKLDSTLKGTVVSECFSQNREELVLRFETNGPSFFIKASLQPQFSCLSFPTNFHRARKNNVDLFGQLIGQRVEAVYQFQDERAFSIDFSNHLRLVFKMHGNRSNLILFEGNNIREVFKSAIVEDWKIDLGKMNRSIDWTYETFLANIDHLDKVYFTFGKVVWQHLKKNGFDTLTVEAKWRAIQNIRDELIQASMFYIKNLNGNILFSLVDEGTTVKTFKDPLSAITNFFSYYLSHNSVQKGKNAALNLLKTKLRSTESYIEKTESNLRELEENHDYKVWADLIMANLHLIAPGSTRVTLPDFYHDNHPTEIKLKADLPPQKNAALFYQKAKNQRIEVEHLKKILASKKELSRMLFDAVQKVGIENDIDVVNKIMEPITKSDITSEKSVPLPYREVIFNGYKIWIGKNASSNDTLTLKFSFKDDLWLHAKDVAGSHVVVKHQAGKNFPKDIIERAAQLAAYYSKRKNESLCPVSVTQRKFVRKRKGDPAGVVVVEREEVLMVEPQGVSGAGAL